MAERFLYELHKGCFRDNGVEMSIIDVLNTLNEQHKQIQEQKRQIRGLILLKDGLIDDCQKLKGKASSWKITASEVMMKQAEIKEENEQLKSANSKLIVDKNGIQGEYEWLKDENEQLKKELESFKPIIFESDGKPVTLYTKGDVE